MAKVAGTPQIISCSKANGESKNHVGELARNLVGALKLEKGDHGSASTSQSEAPFASHDPQDPEPEQETTDGIGLEVQPRTSEEEVKGAAPVLGKPDDAAKTEKKKKKKKKKKKGNPTGGSSGSCRIPSQVGNEDSGWKVHGPSQGETDDSGWRVSGLPIRGEPAVAGAADFPSPRSPNRMGDESVAMEVSSNWDSGWEVAGSSSRRGYKKAEDVPVISPGGPSAGWNAKGGGQQFQRTTTNGASVNPASILGNLLPQTVKGAPTLNPGPAPRADHDALDAWTPTGSSVFDKYPSPSVYSDSQCSDDDSDTMSFASSDSQDSHQSHATQKKNKWFRSFFQRFDALSEEELLHEYECKWHCPPCQGGVGAIDWYTGFQPLLNHAKTIRSRRVKLHKLFAEVLEEEIRLRGAAPGIGGSGKYGKWKGLGDETESGEIVWPPMVVIWNTQLEKDEDDKWIGMGNEELLDLFKKYNPVRARHAYGPQGHRGVSILVFAESPMGCYCAHLLQQAFIKLRRGKDIWETVGKVLFYPGGDRILYGYIATAEDLDFFDKHSKGKQILKWELKSFQEMVGSRIRRQDEENHLVMALQEEIEKLKGENKKVTAENKVLTKSVLELSKRLGLREDEVKSIMSKLRDQDEGRKAEMDDLETLYKEAFQKLKEENQNLEDVNQKRKEENQQLKHRILELDGRGV